VQKAREQRELWMLAKREKVVIISHYWQIKHIGIVSKLPHKFNTLLVLAARCSMLLPQRSSVAERFNRCVIGGNASAMLERDLIIARGKKRRAS
jgi:hypothetical protein